MRFFLFGISFFTTIFCFGQETQIRDSVKVKNIEPISIAEFIKPTRRDSIKQGLVIPENITECFMFLDVIFKPKIDNDSTYRKNILGHWHFGTGLWIRNTWVNKVSMRNYFNQFNIQGFDRISGLIGSGYREYLEGKIPNPEQWLESQRVTQQTSTCIINGRKVKQDSLRYINENNAYSIQTLRELTVFQHDLGLKTNTIIANTKRGWAKCDSILSRRNSDFKKSRKRNKINNVIFIYKNDTIKHFEIIGNENRISINKVNESHFRIKIID